MFDTDRSIVSMDIESQSSPGSSLSVQLMESKYSGYDQAASLLT